MAFGSISVDKITDSEGSVFSPTSALFRNRIINGDMRIDQRNAGAAVTSGAAFPVDRFVIGNATDGAYSAQQDSSAPPGFVKSLKITITTADTSLTSAQILQFRQAIEGTNTSDFAWGTANAKPVTLSFWVRSSLTGTFGGSLRNSDADRSYPFTYTISTADTWEYKTITVAGDTSGTWLTTNGVGIYITFSLGSGSDKLGTPGAWNSNNNTGATGETSVVGTLNATWYITGVQLEVGSVATPFERRPYGTELALCQRYYYRIKATGVSYPFGFGQCYSTTLAGVLIPYPVTMRVAPSALEQSGTAADYLTYSASGTGLACSVVPAYASILTTPSTAAVNFTVTTGLTSGNATQAASASSSAYLGWSAEL